MTATLLPQAPTRAAAQPTAHLAPARFTDLLRVEIRKLVDTRADRWLLLLAVLASIGATALAVAFFETDLVSDVFLFALVPLGMLVPVVAILAATAEWSQRTGLVTFAMEPRRWRVLVAKLIASQLAGVALMVAATAIAYAGAGLAAWAGHGWASWSLQAGVVGGVALNQSLVMLQASAIGFILLNTPAAVVVFFIVPQLWTTVAAIVAWLTERAHWLDLNQAIQPLVSGAGLTGQGWLHLATAAGIWVLLPLAAGVVRFIRAEVK